MLFVLLSRYSPSRADRAAIRLFIQQQIFTSKVADINFVIMQSVSSELDKSLLVYML